MPTFSQIVKTETAKNAIPFKGSPLRNGKITKTYRKYIMTISNNAPLPPNLAFNPSTNRIVKYSSVYDLRYKKPVYKKKIKNYLEFDNFKTQIAHVNKDVGNSATFDFKTISNIGLSQFLSKLNLNNPVLLTIENTDGRVSNYTLNDLTLPRLRNFLSGEQSADYVNASGGGSDEEALVEIREIKTFTLKQLPKSKKQQAAFYKYTLKYPLPDVERFGLFTSLKSKNYEECCFINALVASGKVSDKVIANIKLSIKCAYLPMCKIKDIAEKFDLYIRIYGLDTKSKRINEYGEKENPEIKIGLVDQHYFYITKTQFTSYSLKNYRVLSLTHPETWNTFIKKNARDATRFISSLEMFKLFRNDQSVRESLLEPITISSELFRTPHFKKIDDFPALAVGKLDYKPAVDWEKRATAEENRETFKTLNRSVWVDFETNVYGDKHVPYLGWYITESGETFEFLGEDCGKQMLNHLYEAYGRTTKTITRELTNKKTGEKFEKEEQHNLKLLMFAHNASYDFTTALFSELYGVSTIEKGSSLMSANASFYKFGEEKPLKICVHDTYAIIPEPLRKFGKMFNLEQEKEVMPYPVYNTKNIKKKFICVKECLKALKPKDHAQFLRNCEEWMCERDGKINIIKYSSLYCRMDCVVLRAGYIRFQEMINEICESLDIKKLNIDNFISAASIADEFIIRSKCYDDCVQMCGVPRAFIQRCLVGGRTMLNNNVQQSAFNVKMADYDAVSLYPSAMNRLDGFLKGAPKLIDTCDYEKLCAKSNGFFARVKITSVGQKRDFALLSYINEKGIRTFTNDIVGQIIYIDDVALSDAIRFQKITFEIIDGYYFNEGFNDKIVPTIRFLFNERVKAKKQENPVQAVIKLIMNSCYGKTALKEINEESNYIPNKYFEKYVTQNYNWIKEAVKTEDGRGYRVKTIKPINTHFNRVHIGIQILSMSKRIMNEVMCLADDEKLKIYYQDTDSMHIMENDVSTLENAFLKKYDRQLHGKGMGQFHVDFELGECSNVYAEHSIFLGKKSYIDCLVGTNAKGEEERGYHIRMKGVPNSCILGECKKRKCSPLELYQELKKGRSVKFNLLVDEDGDVKVRFKKENNVTMTTVAVFNRVVSFDTTTESVQEIKNLF